MILHHDSQEQFNYLTDIGSGVPESNEDMIFEKQINLNLLERNEKIPGSFAEKIEKLHGLPFLKRTETLLKDSKLIQVMFDVIRDDPTSIYSQYVLAVLHEASRDDTYVLEIMVSALDSEDIYQTFYKVLSNDVPSHTKAKTAYLLTCAMAYGKEGMFTEFQIKEIVQFLFHSSNKLLEYSRLDCVKNLLKLDGNRNIVWSESRIKELVLSSIKMSKPDLMYPATFCVWTLTFNDKYLESIVDSNVVREICHILKEVKTEKVMRICAQALMNCMKSDAFVETMIQEDTAHVLTVLQYEKWRDGDLYTEIKNLLQALQQKMKLFSNFERYCRELESGKLKWSYLHSEKFWHANVMHFEGQEFQAIKKLMVLLQSSDPTIASVACFDLGEFARLYPTGKQVLQKLRAKELVMLLLTHKDRNVSRQALACVQKIMLDNWRSASSD